MKNGLPILVLVITITSCVSEIPIEETFIYDQIVISGLVSPKISPEVQLSYTRNLTWNDSMVINKPYSFTFYEDNQLVFSKDDSIPNIHLPLILNQKHTYSFSIQINHKIILAKTSVPEQVNIEQSDIIFSDISTTKDERYFEATIQWSDPPNISNFYEIQIINKNGSPLSFYNYHNISDPVLLQEAGLDFQPASFVFSDVSFSGSQYQMKLIIDIGASGTYPNLTPHDYWVVLRSVSQEYYRYIKSWHKHSYQQNTGIQVDESLEEYDYISLLLKGDPVPLYSNIENGIGIFAGYSEDVKKFTFVQ